MILNKRKLFLSLLVLLLVSFTANVEAIDTAKKSATKTATTVTVWLWITDILDIDFPKNQITVEGYLTLFYPKNSSAGIKPLKNAEIITAKVFEKIHENFAKVEKRKSNTLKDSCKFKLILKHTWNAYKYPFDKYRIDIVLEDFENDAEAQVYKIDPESRISPDVTVSGWNVSALEMKNVTQEYLWWNEKEIYSRTIGSFYIERSSRFTVFIKSFMTMFIALCLTFISLRISATDLPARFGLPVASIFAIVGNQNMVNARMPEISSLGYANLMHIISYAAILICVAFSVYSLKICKSTNHKLSDTLDRKAFIFIPSIYAIASIIVTLITIYSSD